MPVSVYLLTGVRILFKKNCSTLYYCTEICILFPLCCFLYNIGDPVSTKPIMNEPTSTRDPVELTFP